MRLFDSMKDAVQPLPPQQFAPAEPEPDSVRPETAETVEVEAFDIAGFDPLNDEEAFFNALLHMESDWELGETEESRAEIQARFLVRDLAHWMLVRRSVYHLLVRKHGSLEAVWQREASWRNARMDRRI